MRAGNQYSSATTYVSCYANIMAEVFATALAEATASASCWAYSGDADAVASITAEVRAELKQYEYCTINVSETGLADGSADGFALTGVVCRIRCACSALCSCISQIPPCLAPGTVSVRVAGLLLAAPWTQRCCCRSLLGGDCRSGRVAGVHRCGGK